MTVYITGCLVEESKFVLPDKTGWTAKRLIKKSRKLPVFDLQLQALPLNIACWSVASVDEFIFHMNRVNKTSLKYPIILSSEGIILDGWHRVVKAIINGDETIKAVRFKRNPSKNIKGE